MRDILIRILDLPAWIKITAGILLIIAIIAAGGTTYVTTRPVEWIEQPVMLRLLKGEVKVSESKDGEFISDVDNTWLNSGNYIEVGNNSTVLLQYFDSSMAKIKGPAEIIASWSRSADAEDLSKGRSISIKVLKGTVSFLAAEYHDSKSFFEVVTPASVGVVEGTIFTVSVDDNGGTSWRVADGIVRAGSITSDDKMDTVILLKPLSSCDAVFIPGVIEESVDNQSIPGRLLTITQDMVQESAEQNRSDIRIESVSMLVKDDEIDLAAYKAAGLSVPTKFSSIPEVPLGYEILDYDVIKGGKFNIVFAKSPTSITPFFPSIPLPDIWQEDDIQTVRKNAPRYISSIMGIDGPLGIAVDNSGQHICVTQSAGNRNTLVFDAEGNRIMTLAPPNTTVTERAPSYVAIDWTGVIYVSDRLRRTIDMYDEESNYLGTFIPKNNPDIVWSPLGLATDANGHLYVTDVTDTQHRVIVCNSRGEQILEFGQSGTGPGSFSFPNDITVDDEGRIIVSDSNNQRVQVFNSIGDPIVEYIRGGGGEINFPRGVGIDGRYLYVVDTFDHRVKVYDMDNMMTPVFQFGGYGTDDGLFSFPNGLAVDATGKVYVTDRDNNRVQIFGY